MNSHQTQKEYTKSGKIFISDAYTHYRAMKDCLLETDLTFKAMLYLLRFEYPTFLAVTDDKVN